MARPFPDVEGVTHRYVDTGRLTMHVAEAGPPGADPVLMLHGWPQHWYEWRHQIPTLAQHYRGAAPDARAGGGALRGAGSAGVAPRGPARRAGPAQASRSPPRS